MTFPSSPRVWGSFAFVAVLLTALFAHWTALAPRPVPASAPPTEFSAERAFRHIDRMAQETHPAGSLGCDEACKYIQAELAALGVEIELIDLYARTGERGVSNRRAVLGRIRGTAPTKAFAMDAHFDSVPYGPGATDDFSGIAAMLETARALKASPPLKNDVIFVFADQEEFSGGGAKAFCEHPWFGEVGVMLGLETRGTKGAALMFETSPNNGWVIRELAKAGVNPRATSIMFDVYDRLPFGSDFGHYKNHVAGLNVAYVDDFCYYHTRLDCPEEASLASLQHHGAYTLGLAKHFGEIPLDDCYAPNATYFNTIGGHMIVYPQSWGWPLTFGGLTLLGLVLLIGLVRKRLSVGGILAGAGVVLAAMVVAAGVAGGLTALLFWRFREMGWYQTDLYSLSFAAVAGAGLLLFVGLLRGLVRAQNLLAGVLLWWAALLVLIQMTLPGGTYTALWPLVFGTANLFLLCQMAQDGRPGPAAIGLGTLFALPAFVLLVPSFVMFAYTLTFLGGVGINPLVVLLLALVAPAMTLIHGHARWYVPGALAALGAACFGAGYMANLPSPSCPRLNCLSYGMDFNTGKAYWLSADRELDEWTGQFFPAGTVRQPIDEFTPGRGDVFLKAPAPPAPFPKTKLEVRNDRLEGGRRIVDLFLDSPLDPQRTYITVMSDTEVFGVHVLGHDLSGAKKNWSGRFEILPREGTELRFEVGPEVPLVINVRETAYGVPQFPGFKPRPDWMATEPNRTVDHRRALRSEHTFATCTFDLGTVAGQ